MNKDFNGVQIFEAQCKHYGQKFLTSSSFSSLFTFYTLWKFIISLSNVRLYRYSSLSLPLFDKMHADCKLGEIEWEKTKREWKRVRRSYVAEICVHKNFRIVKTTTMVSAARMCKQQSGIQRLWCESKRQKETTTSHSK